MPFTISKGRAEYPKDYPNDWPAYEFFVEREDLTSEVVKGFEKLVHSNSGETALDNYLTENPSILSAFLNTFSTGHNGSWVIPKQNIKMKVGVDPGLIPDFLVGGQSSFGITWYVVELKGANNKLFTRKQSGKMAFTEYANEAFLQTLGYINYCQWDAAYLRSQKIMPELRDINTVLILGRDSETNDDPKMKELKAGLNNFSNNISIRSFDAVLRACQLEAAFQASNNKGGR